MSINTSKWKKVFPLTRFSKPLLENPSKTAAELAEHFCPKLHIRPKLFTEERKYLYNYRIQEETAEALFLFDAGRFPETKGAPELTGAKLRLLGPALQGISKDTQDPLEEYLSDGGGESVLLGMAHKLLHSRPKNHTLKKSLHNKLRNEVRGLFDALIGEGKPTCVLKYRVTRLNRTNVYCIQYFAYWPIQLFPFHISDYEPVYVYVHKESSQKAQDAELLLIVLNADPGSSIRYARDLWRRKHPGHVIRAFVNWDNDALKLIRETPPPHRSTREIPGGNYRYEAIKPQNHIEQLLDGKGSKPPHQQRGKGGPSLHVERGWHAYRCRPGKTCYDVAKLRLEPLKVQDLFHIEWAISHPFQSPFLYPIAQDGKLGVAFK